MTSVADSPRRLDGRRGAKGWLDSVCDVAENNAFAHEPGSEVNLVKVRALGTEFNVAECLPAEVSRVRACPRDKKRESFSGARAFHSRAARAGRLVR